MSTPFIPREIYEETMSPTARELSSGIEALYKAKSKTNDMMRLFCFHYPVEDDNTVFKFQLHDCTTFGGRIIKDVIRSAKMPIKVELSVNNSDVFTVDKEDDVGKCMHDFVSESLLPLFNTEMAIHNSMFIKALCGVCENGFDAIVDGGKTKKYKMSGECIRETKTDGCIYDSDIWDAKIAILENIGTDDDVDISTPLVAVMSPRTMAMYICNRDQMRGGMITVSGPNISSVDEIGADSTLCGIKLYCHPMMVDHSVYVFVSRYTVGCFDKGATSTERLFYTNEYDFEAKHKWTGEVQLQRRWWHKICVARPFSLVQIKIK